jgi:hypothetical protein
MAVIICEAAQLRMPQPICPGLDVLQFGQSVHLVSEAESRRIALGHCRRMLAVAAVA